MTHLLLIFYLFLDTVDSCSTMCAGRLATTDGSVMLSHSNDGDGDSVGNLIVVPSSTYPVGSNRTVSGGTIPQNPQTYRYFKEGYGIMNEHQVALGESTCLGVFDSLPGSTGILNIVDLTQIALERSTSALQAIITIGALAEEFGYSDNAESLFITDQNDAYIFHILKSSSSSPSAIWAAQLLPPTDVSTVMNAFIISDLDLTADLYSANLVAEAHKLQPSDTTINFKRTFSGLNEAKCKYSTGRRMWSVLNRLSPVNYSPTYDSYLDNNYPTSFLPNSKVNTSTFSNVMRDYYQNTDYDMSTVPKLSGGPFFSPSRWATDQTVNNQTVCWERPIATFRSIVTLITQSRSFSEVSERTSVRAEPLN